MEVGLLSSEDSLRDVVDCGSLEEEEGGRRKDGKRVQGMEWSNLLCPSIGGILRGEECLTGRRWMRGH